MAKDSGNDQTTVWLRHADLAACTLDAHAFYPNETGGALVGWWSDPTNAVITDIVEAGPKAVRTGHSFEPDDKWQSEELAKLYKASGEQKVYLGDWHSHPGATSGNASWSDKSALRKIISSETSRCKRPLLCILWGEPDHWNFSARYGVLEHRTWLWSTIQLNECFVKYY